MKTHKLISLIVLLICSFITKKIISSNLDDNDKSKQQNANAILNSLESPETKPATPNSIKDIKFVNPAEEIALIQPPSANQSGSANLSFPVKLPPGRNGMQPPLSIQYNSEGENGWLGLGWNLSLNSIIIETKWGVPRYDQTMETETYTLNGEQLSPVAHRSDPVSRTAEKQFYPRVESYFDKIIRHGSNPKNYWWEVTSKNGTKNFFGSSLSGVDPNAVLKDANSNIAVWALTETRDPQGNFIKYRYSSVSDAGVTGGNSGNDLYLASITYTGFGTTEGKFSVDFIRDRQLLEPKRPDVSISARLGFKRVTADLLRKIIIKYNGQNVRSYELNYIRGAFYKTLLQSISEFDASGILFNSHTFEYYNDVQDGSGVYNPLSPETSWIPQNDKVAGDFLTPDLSTPFGSFNDKASALAGNKSTGGGFGTAITLGPNNYDLATKSNTAGVTFGFSFSKNEGMLALVDINGDGLIDKVFKFNGGLNYRLNQSGPDGTTTFGNLQSITGINDFSRGTSFVSDVGVESNFLVFAGLQYSSSEEISSTYFTDVNGDQLIDIVKDGTVYFNHIDNAGNPFFNTTSGDTPSPINSASGIDPSLVQNDPHELDSAIDQNPLHDVVKIWQAPFDGTVSITKSVTLIKDLNPGAQPDTVHDGVRVAIQHNGNVLWFTQIAPNDYTPKTPTNVNAISVLKGENIYFRVQSIFNGAFDQVLWSPEITYSSHADTIIDANALPIYKFNAGNDFLLSGPYSANIGFNGAIHIQGDFFKPVTSDDITIKILKRSNVGVTSTILQQNFSRDQSITFPISIDQTVLKGDAFFFSVSCKTNIDWTALQWNPYIYFTASNDPSVTQLFDIDNNPLLYFFPTVDFKSYDKTIEPSLYWTAQTTDTFLINPQPLINFHFLFDPFINTGQLVFSIKKPGQLISKQSKSVSFNFFGIPYFDFSTDTLILNAGDKVYFEYYSDSTKLADSINTSSTIISGYHSSTEINISGLHTKDETFIFGPMYRHWGQFAYNGNRDRATQPIIESDLALDPAYSNPLSIDLSSASGAAAMQDQFNSAGGHNAKDDKFIYLVPDNEKKYWLGYDKLTYVKKDTISSSRMGKDNLLPINPITNNSPGTGSGAIGINKVSRTSNLSFTASASFGVGQIGGSLSTGETKFLYDFKDMNGDWYPDILSTSKIQYTLPYGGLEASAMSPFSGELGKSSHNAVGATLGGTFTKSSPSNAKATPKGAKARTSEGDAEISAGIGGDFNLNTDHTLFAWMDINGDGLPDKVHEGGTVELNLGYSFLPPEQWGFNGIGNGDATSIGAGLSINISNHSIVAGVGFSRTQSQAKQTLQDMNGDGLLDYIEDINPLKVRINTGNGFTAPIEWLGASKISETISTGESANGAFTIGIPIPPPPFAVVKLCINPSINVSHGANRNTIQFDDINGDGFPDLLRSNVDNELKVSLSTIKKTNKLKKINRPLRGNFTLDYKRIGNTYQMPNSVWTLASVDIYDGVPGDGADFMRNTFTYENGYYDRNERDFLGFGKVTTNNHNTRNLNSVFRMTVNEYINDNFYEKGLLKSEVFKNATGDKFTETVNAYQLKDIQTGVDLPAIFKQSDDGAAFTALVSTNKLYYEGQATAGKTTLTTYAYDLLGNVISTTDFGDAGSADDITDSITYHSVPAKYIMNVQSSLTKKGSGIIYRQQATTIDNNTGKFTEVRQYLQSGDIAKSNMEYDAFGNLTKLTKPQNASGQRLTYNYQYDVDVQTYKTRTSDSYGYISSSTYDVRFGKTLSSTDPNNQRTLNTLDNAGRILTITGPLEIASGQAFKYSFEYHPEAAVPWALTKHYDPANPGNFVEAAKFCDGLEREVQTKKDIALYMDPQATDQEKMQVSGSNTFDAFGRIDTLYYPVLESKGTTGVLNNLIDSIRPTITTYDVLDRILTTTRQDLSITTMQYSFGTDRDGALQFKTSIVDGNGISNEKYINVRELLKATKEQYSQGTDVWTSYDYNPVDELLKVTDDKGNKIIYTYDRMGRRTSDNHPDAGLTTYQYDLNNNPIQVITANLQGRTGIRYTYDQERLLKITYPQNTQNNVTLAYGATGSAVNGAGRIIKQVDATGNQEFSYNALGILIKNKRNIVSVDTVPLTLATEWTYDTWNRLTGMLYPDNERLTYNYNVGGLLKNMSGVKAGIIYNYLTKKGYDKFEDRVYMKYGNGTEMTYSYESDRRRLQKLTSKTAANRLTMDDAYSYDKENNILSIINNAPIPLSNLMGGKSNYQYTYDDLYRLTNTNGKFSGSNQEHRYTLTMTYDNLFSIVTKNQVHERKGYDETVWSLRNQTSYNYSYNYNPAGKPHAPVHIGTRSFTYDANGNQAGWRDDVNAQNRQIVWDEENRIKTITDNGQNFRYTYDGSGQRILKSLGQGQNVKINGRPVIDTTSALGNYRIYVNPYIEVCSGSFTKHFYIEGGRIASKYVQGGNPPNNIEAFQFYFHSDHLGNTSFVTDRLGEVYQHLEYFPFGETFIDEHGNQERTHYLYNGKELDDETSLYYYGARYYDTRVSEWESADPLANKFPNKSPYNYAVDNPIRYIDVDGRKPGDMFKTIELAASDFGKTYNGNSILQNREYGTYITKTGTGKDTRYTYVVPTRGKEAKGEVIINISDDAVGYAHTHAKGIGASTSVFSPQDISAFEDIIKDPGHDKFKGFVVTPNGSLIVYDPAKHKPRVINTKMPSDPNDPYNKAYSKLRKNKIDPVENKALLYKDQLN